MLAKLRLGASRTLLCQTLVRDGALEHHGYDSEYRNNNTENGPQTSAHLCQCYEYMYTERQPLLLVLMCSKEHI